MSAVAISFLSVSQRRTHFFYIHTPPSSLQIDKDGANPERVMQELSSIGMIPEDWGGDIPMVQVCKMEHIIELNYLVTLLYVF